MIQLRKSDQRGHADHGWLNSYHSFSFADYYDPAQMGFRQLRVINEDRVEGGQGFGTHGHRNMEIVSYVLEGSLAHKDSLGTGAVMKPGDVQRMTAGRGVTHSEFNQSPTQALHFLQIWILPEKEGLEPSYEQRHFSEEEKLGKLRLVAAPGGRDGALTLHQDVELYATVLDPGQQVELPLSTHRHAWVQLIRGAATLNGGVNLVGGDGAALSGEARVQLLSTGSEKTEALVFNLA